MDDSLKDTEWWWIDYLEGEFDPALDKDLQLLLEHSEEDRGSFENFRILKQWVRESDPALENAAQLDVRLDRLRSIVMKAVMASPLPGSPEPKPKPPRDRAWDACP